MTLKAYAKCVKINARSRSPAFDKIKVGQVIRFTVDVKPVGQTSKYSRAAYIKCTNMVTKKESLLSFNQIGRVLANCEWETY